jgi:hypothetical protein
MAMLLLPRIFARTWGPRTQPADGSEATERSFWPEAIARICQDFQNFLFIAEAYWDTEWELVQLGFDYAYDKRLYDRLVERDVDGVRAHLGGGSVEFQRKLVRFLENHDERRAGSVFPLPVHQAAAVLAYLTPGMRLFHEGQLEGRKVKLSIHLARRPAEAVDEQLQDFYCRLLACVARPEVQTGEWNLLKSMARPGGENENQIIAFVWTLEGQRVLAAVNYFHRPSSVYLNAGAATRMEDLLSVGYARHTYDASGALHLELPEWGYSVVHICNE